MKRVLCLFVLFFQICKDLNAISVVQTPQNATGSNSVALAFGSNLTAASTIVVVCRVASASATTTVSDTKSQIYSTALGPIRGNPQSATFYVFYFDNTASGADTVTCNSGSGGNVGISIYEVSGLSSSSSLDQSSNTISGNGTPVGGTITTTVASEFIVSAITTDGGEPTSMNAGWTLNDVGNSNWYDSDAYSIPSSIVTSSATFIGVSGNYTGVIASFKAPAAAASAPSFRGLSIQGKTAINGAKVYVQ